VAQFDKHAMVAQWAILPVFHFLRSLIRAGSKSAPFLFVLAQLSSRKVDTMSPRQA